MFRFAIYYNYEEFDSNSYGEASIRRQSRMDTYVQMKVENQNAIDLQWQSSLLSDTTDLFQLGNASERYYHGPKDKTTELKSQGKPYAFFEFYASLSSELQ